MFLHDKPEDNDIRFGHKVLAKWLASRIVEAPSPYRLGITAQLGTGKSTIIEKAIEFIREDLGKAQVKTAIVDVWKLDKENVRRSALIKIGKDLLDDDNFLLSQQAQVYESLAEENKNRSFNWSIDKKILWIRPTIIFFSFFILSLLAYQSLNWISAAFIALIVAFVDLSQNFFKTVLVRSKSTSSRAPWIGSEEFEEGLQQILEHNSLKEKQVVIVFDNIDRAHGESTKSILSGISAFFDHSHKDRVRNIKIIVPYDSTCLSAKLDMQRPVIDDCEKMFDAILTLPKLTREDLTDFASDKYKECLSEFSLPEEVLKDLAILTDQSPFNNPRSIKHLANQFSGLFNLADFFEKNVEDRISGSPTLLPVGSVTHHPVSMLKFLICDKISPGFLQNIVSSGIEPKRAFEDDEFVEKHYGSNSELANFLSASRGIPNNCPSSATPFLFLKGPDQVLSIAGGAALSDAFYANDVAKLKGIAFENGKRQIKDSSFEAILRFHRTKFSSNKQVIKNTVFSFLSLFDTESQIDKGLAQVLCECIIDIADQIGVINLRVLSRLTKEYINLDKVQKVWNMAAVEFEGKMNSDSLGDSKNMKWAIEFHSECVVKGLVKLNEATKYPLVFLLEKEVFETVEDFGGPQITDSSVMEAVNLLLSKNCPMSKEVYLEKLVSERFSKISEGSFVSIQASFMEKFNQWKSTQIDWYSKDEANTDVAQIFFGNVGEQLAKLIYYWPTQYAVAKKELDFIYSQIVNDLTALNNKATGGNARDVLKMLAMGYLSGGFPDHHHIDQNIQTALNSAKTGEDVLASFELVPDKEKLVTLLTQKFSVQFFSAIDRLKLVEEIFNLIESVGVYLNFLIDNLNKATNTSGAIVNLLGQVDLTDELISKITSKVSFVKGEARINLFKILEKNTKNDALLTVIQSFILLPDGSSQELRGLSKALGGDLLKAIISFSESQLRSVSSLWGAQHLELFKWSMLAPNATFDSQLQDQIESAIRWGIANQTDPALKNELSELVLEYWEKDIGFKAKNLIALRDHLGDQHEARLNALAQKNNVKEGFFAKLFGTEG